MNILNDNDRTAEIARRYFNAEYLYPWQRLVIANIIDSVNFNEEDESFSDQNDDEIFCRGRQIVLLPTGAGKSMCFLVPSLLLSGATLVIYPLLALMADQMRRMAEAKIPCVVFKGGQTEREREDNFKLLEEENPAIRAKVILANPEVLQDSKLIERLCKVKISHIAVDEAHCVSEWGDSFRPSYLTLGKIIKDLNVKVVTAFTATASPAVLKRIAEILFDGHFHLIQSAGDRENIHYEVMYAYAKKKAALKCALVMKKPMIIFCGTRRRSEEMARLLISYFGNEKAKFYHAGMTKEEKNAVEKWFFESSDGILAATCAYGMGMDKGNIYSVVHLDAPLHLENFAQEAGRAGRKGDNVNSVLIWEGKDSLKWKHEKEGSREKAMGDFALSKTCRRQFLLDYLGCEKTVCSGCDVCDSQLYRRKLSYKASDAELAYRFIKRNRRIYKQEEITGEITDRLNKRDISLFGENIWETKDTAEILSQLFYERRIKKTNFLFENRLDVVNEKIQKLKLKLIPKPFRHRYWSLRHHLRKIHRRLKLVL